MKLRDIVAEAYALVQLRSREKEGSLRELISVLDSAGSLKSARKCLTDVLKREQRGTTGIGRGIGIPHACTDGVLSPVLAIGRNKEGIEFGSLDKNPVNLVFMLLGPEASANLLFRILARLSQILRQQELVERILSAEEPSEVLQLFEDIEEELGEIPTPEDKPVVCVVGAGAGGLTMAGHLALVGCRVTIFNRSLPRIESIIKTGGVQVSGQVSGFARIKRATTDPEEALSDADLVMVVVPATAHRDIARLIGPYLKDGQIVILNPGRTFGAVEFVNTLREMEMDSRAVIAEAQTLLYACRSSNPGSVNVFRVKSAVPVAALPAYLTPDVLSVCSKCLPQFVAGDNVLKTGLENIGAVFHPALTILNAAWIEERHGEFQYYHEGASPSVAMVLESLDRERVSVASALGVRVLSARDWLYIAYGASGENLYEAMQANPGYGGILAPNTLNHRYITEDVPMSLVPIASLADQLGVPVPTIKVFIHLASIIHGRDYFSEGRTVERLGLKGLSVQQIMRFVIEGTV